MEESLSASRPHGKIPLGIVAGFFVLIGVSAFVPASWFGIEKKAIQSKLDLSIVTQPGKLATDTDKDGEVSWKELAISSLGIDPAKAENVHIEMSKQDLDTLNDPDNLTSSFSKNMYMASLAIQKQGGVLDEESKQNIVNQLMDEEAAKLVSKTYAITDITTVPDNSAAIKDYGNSVAAAIKSLISQESIIDTLTSLDAYSNKGNEGDLLPIQKHAAAAEETMKKLLAIKVPVSMASEHIILLNKYEAYKDLIHNLASIKEDALRSTLALKKYQETTSQALRERSTIVLLMKTKGVIFSSSEPGYWFSMEHTQ